MFFFRAMGDNKNRQVIMLIKIIITCTYAITGLTVASHPQRCFLVTVKISPYKKKVTCKMENNRNFPARQFHSLTFFAGFGWYYACGWALAARKGANADDTLVVEASTPSLYAPQQSADPKFSRPVADTTRTMTVISEQVIKRSVQPTLPTRSKRPRRVRFAR